MILVLTSFAFFHSLQEAEAETRRNKPRQTEVATEGPASPEADADPEAAAARAEMLAAQRSRGSLVHQEQRRKRDVRLKMQAAVRIQRAWRLHRFRKAHPELAARERAMAAARRPPAVKAGGVAAGQPRRAPHRLPAMGMRKSPSPAKDPSASSPAGQQAYERETRRPDFTQRTIAALTIQLWWRRILAQRGRDRRRSLQMREHDTAAYLVRLQRARVRNIYGPGQGSIFLYKPAPPGGAAAASGRPVMARMRAPKTKLPPVQEAAAKRQPLQPAAQLQQRAAAEKMLPRHRSAPTINRLQPIPAIAAGHHGNRHY
jgi:hypothetical protein